MRLALRTAKQGATPADVNQARLDASAAAELIPPARLAITTARMVRAAERWTSCVREKTGEAYEDSEAVEVDVLKRLAAVVGPLPDGEFAPGAFASLTPEGPYDSAALAEVRRLEVEFSTADVACEEKYIVPVEDTVRAEKERVFREANAELLRRVKPLGG